MTSPVASTCRCNSGRILKLQYPPYKIPLEDVGRRNIGGERCFSLIKTSFLRLRHRKSSPTPLLYSRPPPRQLGKCEPGHIVFDVSRFCCLVISFGAPTSCCPSVRSSSRPLSGQRAGASSSSSTRSGRTAKVKVIGTVPCLLKRYRLTRPALPTFYL